MLDYSAFKNWLVTSSNYSKKTVSNIISRLKRADAILPWYDDEVYLFHLEQAVEYIAPDELVEITPTSVRLRKKILNIHERRKASRKEEAAEE